MQIFFHLKIIVYTNYGLFTEQNTKSKVHLQCSKIKDKPELCFIMQTRVQVGQLERPLNNCIVVPTVVVTVITILYKVCLRQ